LGKRFHFINQDVVREVVGIAKDVNYRRIGEEPLAYIYLPRLQNYQPGMSLLVRTAGEPNPILATLRNELQRLEPALPITSVQTIPQVLHLSLWPARMAAGLLGVLGFVALLLASIGIYGVMSGSVSQRYREIGIRMALGAHRNEVLRLFLKRGMFMVALGIGTGLLLAGLVSRMITSLLYDVSPTDLETFLLTPLILAVVAFLACYIPSRRATGVDPVKVLKYE
jgi:ABC-type antimicrobial peptide transport system permease subunit